MSKIIWQDRTTLQLPFWTVCFSQEEFEAALKHCDMIPSSEQGAYRYINTVADATTHSFTNDRGECVVIVCMPSEDIHTAGWIALAAHEARHVVERFFEMHRGLSRCEEHEAILIQLVVTGILKAAYDFHVKRTKKKKKKRKSK